jgi:PAS domain S-box-containing protein
MNFCRRKETAMSLEFLAESEVVYRALIDAVPDGIVIVNQEGRIVLVNTQTEKLFGYDRAELKAAAPLSRQAQK